MQKRLIFAAGAGLLIGVSLVSAAPRANLPAAAGASTTSSVIEVAGRHDRSWSSSSSSSSSSRSSRSSSSSSSVPAGRAWGSPGRRWNAPAVTGRAPSTSPSFGPRVVTPYTAGAGRSYYGGGPRWVRPHGRFGRRHVSIRLLAPIIIAGSTYYAYRYLPYDGPVCSGITENGCELRWMDVPLEDSDEMVSQCVEFCPQQ